MLGEALRRQALMDEMMERCGVDVLKVIHSDRGQSFAEARAKCRLCQSVMTCRAWLLTANCEAPPEFCPNSSLFRTCLKKR
jgi:hypothetical protein